MMNKSTVSFQAFIERAKKIAIERGLCWDFSLDENGIATSDWDLTKAVGAKPTKNFYLRNLGVNTKVFDLINNKKVKALPLDEDWQDLIKAATCLQLFVKRNTLDNICNHVIPPLIVLATCCLPDNIKPWNLTLDIVNCAINLSKQIQRCGKLSDTVIGVVNNIIDLNHLSRFSPIYPSISFKRLVPKNSDSRSNLVKSKDELLESLSHRKSQKKLPEQRAFWELMRIIFTEEPVSITDALRFSALKVQLFTGFRVGEVVLLPQDWKRKRDYFDPSGTPAGDLGGYSSALLIRHFSEKQQTRNSNSIELFENIQYVPRLFEDHLVKTLDYVDQITKPLRDTLKLQCETRRLFPWYAKTDNVPVTSLYTRLTGNPFWLKVDEKTRTTFIDKYHLNFDHQVLNDIDAFLNHEYLQGNTRQLNHSMYTFFNRLVNSERKSVLVFRKKDGTPIFNNRFDWGNVYLNIGELEEFLKINRPTKTSDTTNLKTVSGDFSPWELMFLLPKRALSEVRNQGITDLVRYNSVGIPDNSLITSALGENKKEESLFQRYGENSDDKSLILVSHSLRHLQTSELLRLGVADTIISKIFNRRNVTQSYVYDHRSLSESLSQVELPDEIEASLGEKSSIVAKLIKIAKASGPIVDTFKKIQLEQGDLSAYEYLRVEADGFHATPYGHCINSFTVEPCPKHLECFAGCRHLTATNLPENIRNIQTLEKKLVDTLNDLEARSANTIGIANQKAHALIRLENVRNLLKTSDGQPAFPDGDDFSKIQIQKSVLDDLY